MGDFCPEKVSKGIKVACSGGRRERRDKGLGSAEFTGTKQQVNHTKQKEWQYTGSSQDELENMLSSYLEIASVVYYHKTE